jgi:hypothetical protein
LENPPSVQGCLEAKVKSFWAIPQVFAFLKDYKTIHGGESKPFW